MSTKLQLPIIDSAVLSNSTVPVTGGTQQTVQAYMLGTNNVVRLSTVVRTVKSGQPTTTVITTKIYAPGQYPNHPPATTFTNTLTATVGAKGADGKYPVALTVNGGNPNNTRIAPYSGSNGVQPTANPFAGMSDDDALAAALSAKNLT